MLISTVLEAMMKVLAGLGLAAVWGFGLVHAHGLWTSSAMLDRERMAQSQVRWGERYLTGDGVDRNEWHGVEWLRLAAKNGSAEAFLQLAELHLEGAVLPHDPTLAYLYITFAERLKPSISHSDLREALERRMSTLQKEDAQALLRQHEGWRTLQPLPQSGANNSV